MSLHNNPIIETVQLPDGRNAEIRVGILQDPYVADRLLDTVSLDVSIAGHGVAALTTVLDADNVTGAQSLAREVARALASGDVEPTAAALEPLADTLR